MSGIVTLNDRAMVHPVRRQWRIGILSFGVTRLVAGVMVALLVSCVSTIAPPAKESPLREAVRSGDAAAVSAALRAGSGVNDADHYGETPLFFAVKFRDVDIVETLLAHHADPNRVADNGDTPIIVAARRGNLAVITALAKNGADIDGVGEDGATPLAIAVGRADTRLFDLLVSLGANPDASVARRDTALIKSVRLKDRYFFDRLMVLGADPNACGYRGNTALMAAFRAGHLQMAEDLIAAGARVTDRNDSGLSALMFAVWAVDTTPDVVRLLLAKGADINERARNGITPLMMAAYTNKTDVAKFLIARGANVDLVTDGGYSALLFALAGRMESVKLIQLLVDSGADVNRRSMEGSTALELACVAGWADTIAYLYERGAKADFGDEQPKNLLLDATFKQVMGDRYLARGDNILARSFYDQARSDYKELAQQGNWTIAKIRILGALELVTDALSQVDVPAPTTENNRRARELQQVQAMKYADQTQTGYQGYVAYLDQHRNSNSSLPSASYSPTKRSKSQNGNNAPSNGVERYIADIRVKQGYFERRAAVLDYILKCLDTKSRNKVELRACVGEAEIKSKEGGSD
jgi:ankyrin repeat protein